MPAPRVDSIAPLVHSVRGERVLFDADLAILYGVSTKALNQAVKRNRNRFPADFMFRLTADEAKAISVSRSQTVTLKRGQNIKYLPYAFTTFVQLRRLMDSNQHLARKIDALEKKYDGQFALVFDAIKRLIAERDAHKAQPKRRIGFVS